MEGQREPHGGWRMERHWYLARAGQVYGPIPEWQLFQSAAAGQVFATDWLNPVGQPGWWPATAIPGLLPPMPVWQPGPPQPALVPATVVPEEPANPFTGLETPADFQARMHEKAQAASEGSLSNAFEGLVDGLSQADAKSVADTAKTVRKIANALSDWLGGADD